MEGEQLRVEVDDTGGDVHAADTGHVVSSVIAAEVRASSNGVRLDETVGVERQQLHTLGQYELASTAGTGAVLAVAGQDCGTLGHQALLHLLRAGLHQLGDVLFGHEVYHRVQITVSGERRIKIKIYKM